MSGNENFPTRPKEAQPASILAGSPLAVLGIFLEIARSRFAEDAGLGVVWRPDVELTDILIEAGYNVESESRNNGRAVYITRNNTSPIELMVGDRVGVRLPDHLEGFACMMGSRMSIDCVSNDAGGSTALADIIQHTFIAMRSILRRQYGFHEVSLAEMGPTLPFEQDQAKWSTTITVDVQYHARWTSVKIRPLLQDIGLHPEFYVTQALASLQRDTSTPDGAILTQDQSGYLVTQDGRPIVTQGS